MKIETTDQYIAAAKQKLIWTKTSSRTTVAAMPFSCFDLAGNPGAGVLAVGNTANGIVPTAIAGYPTINAFGGGATGYLTRFIYFSSVASTVVLYDRVFSCGAYNYNDATTLTAQPSYVSRCPGSSYVGLELWVEMVTAATLNQAVAVQYTDQGGNAGHTTAATGIGAAPTVGRMWQLPLAGGDSGVSVVEKVTGTVASAGTFNIHVMRRLAQGRIGIANWGETQNMITTGSPIIYQTSALFPVIYADSTSSGVPSITMEIANA